MEEIPRNEVFKHPWSFVKNEDGFVMLAMLSQGVLVPALVFYKPETLMDFADSTSKAVKEFIALPLREAIEIVNKGWDIDKKEDNKNEGTNDEGGARVPREPKPFVLTD